MTERKMLIALAVLLLAVSLLAGCAAGGEETATPEPVVQTDITPVISATGKVVPETWATISTQVGGVVAEVLVEEGDRVESGQVLVRLQGEENLLAAVAAAELELTAAKVALNDIYDQDYALLAAQARQRMDETQKALDDLLDAELQQALAAQALAEAEKAVEDAQRELNRVRSTASQADIDAAKAAVILAEDALNKAREDFEPYANKPEDNLVRANLQARLSAAQQAYDDAVRRLNALQSTGDPLDIAIAEARLATAQAQLHEAQRDWEEAQEGPDPDEVALLEAQIANAERDWQRYKEGPDPDDVALAEARIANAEAQLAAAQAALEDLEIRAPFAGTVSALFVKTGEWIAPGQPVLQLADLGNLIVETTDLSEIDVAQIGIGESAQITFDALPGVVVEGVVTSIAPKASEGAGVNYKVRLSLSEIPPGLRWEMTAFVDIEIDE